MHKQIEIQGMKLEIEWTFEDELVIDSVNWISDSWNFLEENIEHSCLEKVQYRELGNQDYINEYQSIHDFYQLAHYEQLEIIKNMLNYDDTFHHYFIDDLEPTEDDKDFYRETFAGI